MNHIMFLSGDTWHKAEQEGDNTVTVPDEEFAHHFDEQSMTSPGPKSFIFKPCGQGGCTICQRVLTVGGKPTGSPII